MARRSCKYTGRTISLSCKLSVLDLRPTTNTVSMYSRCTPSGNKKVGWMWQGWMQSLQWLAALCSASQKCNQELKSRCGGEFPQAWQPTEPSLAGSFPSQSRGQSASLPVKIGHPRPNPEPGPGTGPGTPNLTSPFPSPPLLLAPLLFLLAKEEQQLRCILFSAHEGFY